MILLNAHQISFSLPGRVLLEDVNLSLSKGEKVGLVGRNGTGKSTLLKILSGMVPSDSGEVTLRSQTTMRYLDQLPELEDLLGLTLREAVTRGAPKLQTLRTRYEQVCRELESAPDPKRAELEKELNKLTDQLTLHDAWDLETRADTLITTMGFPDPEQTFTGLSGGEKKRISMAQTLLVPPDILLLDEPTNHLDITTISWLEEFLKRADFAVLMVTHDRYFLERVCRRIFEVADLTLHTYEGSYTQYLEQKAERTAQKIRKQEKFENVMRQEQAWLRQGPKARSTKQKARLQRIQSMLEEGSGVIEDQGQTEEQAWDLGTRRLGKKVATLDIESHKILKSFQFTLEPGERVGLVGSNGSGKTTFLKLLTGNTPPEHGTVIIGDTVHTGFLDQHTDSLSQFPPQTRVLEALQDVATTIPLSNGKSISAARLCEMFLFVGSQQATPLERLSGGERKRLELLRLLISRPNLILADEPTNDLDIDTLSRLEFFLDNFPGCVCVAGHDRFLLQRLCDRILVFRDGEVEEVPPSALDDVSSDFFEAPTKATSTIKSPPPQTDQGKGKRKLSYKEQKRLAELEEKIPQWEETLTTLNREIAEKADSYTAIKELLAEKEEVESKLETGMEEWAELEELKESLRG